MPTAAEEGFDDTFAPEVVLVVGASLVRPMSMDRAAVLQQIAPEPERQRRDKMSVRVPFLLLDGEVAPGFTNLTLGTVVESESCHVLVLSAGLF